ncbi:GDP-mannose 4,6-dehydratase [Croceicoccus sp. F390]|uniref:GDP-mannose 4,6-dehydratase n=1 Tax=Croceicoccus esteveae TaxID=3075597 RepID=A0ABU2ZIA9_9SPHN|nr:NAD-dependent epimerase/dehydratase family protein [Croceicoccus sp. F390]MDT0576106.1 GDP-mannose 4,6-dehydratase [Croceicoccus sp. F390]
MKIAVLGCGDAGPAYGRDHGARLAQAGHDVTCIAGRSPADDMTAEDIRLDGRMLEDPAHAALVAAGLAAGRLRFSEDLDDAIASADLVLIASDLPGGDTHEDHPLRVATRKIAAALAGFTVISTIAEVSDETRDQVAEMLADMRPDADFLVVPLSGTLRNIVSKAAARGTAAGGRDGVQTATRKISAPHLQIVDPQAKTILITGGAGFLGSHLAERLIGEGHQVYCLDNLHTGRWDNLDALVASNRIKRVEHDIVQPLPRMERFDEIYNLACPASPVHYQADPVATLRICSAGVYNVLQRAAQDGAAVFHTSTSEVYGDPEVHPQHEGYHGNVNPVGARSCYDEGKRFAETLMTDFCQTNGLRLRMVRIFNTYGPRMLPDDGRVVSNFITQALQGEPITIYGSGSQTRSFCYVDDMVEGFIRLMAAAEDAEGPMNIGNPAEITVAELASIIIAMTGSQSRVVERPLPSDDPKRRKPDIARAQAILGWVPAVELVQGLQATIAYFKDELGASRLALAGQTAGA